MGMNPEHVSIIESGQSVIQHGKIVSRIEDLDGYEAPAVEVAEVAEAEPSDLALQLIELDLKVDQLKADMQAELKGTIEQLRAEFALLKPSEVEPPAAKGEEAATAAASAPDNGETEAKAKKGGKAE